MRIGELLLRQELETLNVKDILSRLNTGDVIKAQIIEASSDELVLRLADGSVFKASTMIPVNVKAGDFVDFLVSEKIDGKLFLKTVKTGNPQNNIIIDRQKIDAQLIEAGIKLDKTSREIASEIIKMNIDVTGNLIESAIGLAEKFAVIDAKKAGFIAANNINVDINNVQIVSQILEGKFDLSSSLTELSDLLTGIDDNNLLKNLASLLTAENKTTGNSNLSTGVTNSNVSSLNVTNNYSNLDVNSSNSSINITNSNLSTGVTNSNASNLDVTVGNSNLGVTGSNLDLSNKTENITTNPNSAAGSITTDSNGTISNLTPNSDAAADSITANFDDAAGNGNIYVNLETATELENISSKATGFPIDTIDSQSLEQSMQHSDIDNIIDTASKDDTSELKQMIKDIFDNFNVKIKSSGITFRKDEQIDIENKFEHANILDLYNDISEKLELIKESIKNCNLPIYNKIKLTADNIQQNFKLINDLYGNMMYMQIPLNFNDKAAAAGIYILKRNTRKKKIDPGNVTILISLNTKNMGQIDSIISVKGKSTTINFKLENKELVQHVKSSYSDLYNRMIEKGYKLVEMKCSLREQDINLLNAKKIADTETYKRYHSFDFRI